MGMTKGQKFRRVLFSRYGVLALISIGLIPVLMPLLPEGKGGGDRVLGLVVIGLLLTPIAIFVQGLATYVLSLFPETRPNDKFVNLMKIGVFFSPLVVLFWGFVSHEEQDYKKRLEENPEEERGEDLISFLYEDEHEEKK